MRKRNAAKRPVSERVPLQIVQNVNEGWSMDFVRDSLVNSRRIKFLTMADEARELGIPVFAVLQEIGRNKVWSTAVAFAATGIRTYVDAGEVGSLPEMNLPGELLPLSELEKFMTKSTKVAAAR